MRYEDFATNLMRIGEGRGIPAAGRFATTERAVSSVVTVTLTPVSVATITVAAQTFTGIPGVELNDIVIPVRTPNITATAITSVQPTAQNTISVSFINPTAGALTPTSGAYTFLIIKTQ